MNDPIVELAGEILRELGSPPNEHVTGQMEWLRGGGARIIAQSRIAALIRLRMAQFLGDKLLRFDP